MKDRKSKSAKAKSNNTVTHEDNKDMHELIKDIRDSITDNKRRAYVGACLGVVVSFCTIACVVGVGYKYLDGKFTQIENRFDECATKDDLEAVQDEIANIKSDLYCADGVKDRLGGVAEDVAEIKEVLFQ